VRPDGSIRKVLIYRLGSLGDTAVAVPCYRLLARVFPEAERVLLTNFPVHAKAPAAAAVLGDSGLIHDYMRYTAGTRNALELLGLVWRIRRFRPDILVYLSMVRPLRSMQRDRSFFRIACGIERIAGLPGDAELTEGFDPATESYRNRFNASTGLFESEGSRLARLIRELGDVEPDNLANWSLELAAAEREAATTALGALCSRRLIVCGPGTKMQAKDWGLEKWRGLLTRLNAEYPEHGLVLVGAVEDAGPADDAAGNWVSPKLNLCGKLTPRQTAAVIERAQVFLGPDSGPMHLAASVGTPCVIAFSAAGRPGVWFPVGNQHEIVYHQTSCYGCQLQTCVAEAQRCMTSISVEEMAAATRRVLDRRAG
jgi:ADP-heptose:LPS heptosyltransferase